MPRWKARQALGQGGAKWETKDGIMRTGDAWFLTMSNKDLSACTVCVGPGECRRVCTTVWELALSRQNEGKRAARGLGS